MATRKIIVIHEELCDGCGECITACAEGALRIVNGKAKVVNDRFCDGFGDCIRGCPTGALVIESREAPEFDYDATRAHVERLGGADAVRRLEEAAAIHEERERAALPAPSELRQWPVQIHLVQPGAPFFRDRELVIMNTCGPLASAEVHARFLRGRSVVVGCPKLDDTGPYAGKLAAIFRESATPKAIVVRMEVPCCGGLTTIAREAKALSGRTDLVLEEVTLTLDGQVRSARDADAIPIPPALPNPPAGARVGLPMLAPGGGSEGR